MIAKESLGEILHVALRKGCDSKATSLTYNVISAMPNSIWREFLDVVWLGLKVQKVNEKNAGQCLKKAALDYDDFKGTLAERSNLSKVAKTLPESETAGRTDDDIRSERAAWRKIFKLSLEMFDDDDWGGFACYLT